MTKAPSIAILCIAVMAAMGVWFSATAVRTSLLAEVALSPSEQGMLTSAVQLGFVLGAAASAVLRLADVLDPRRLIAAGAALAALANAAPLLAEPTPFGLLLSRFAAGVFLAWVYPPGMKLAAGWGARDRGFLIGLLVGMLTLGSASPHLVAGAEGLPWRAVIAIGSFVALAAAPLVLLVGLGPHHAASAGFDVRVALKAWTDPRVRAANLGYLGHMWELYAMWAWIGAFYAASFAASGVDAESSERAARLSAFATIAAGAAGCIAGGWWADRIGRARFARLALAVSGACCLVAGATFGASPWATLAVGLVWGVAVVADSAQFSALVADGAAPDEAGTLLTVQTCLGFLLTILTIQLLPIASDLVGWTWTPILLAFGPAFGIVALGRLVARPSPAA
jgi:MFS family permease